MYAEGNHHAALVPPPTPAGLQNKGDSSWNSRASCGSHSIENFGKGSENQDTFMTSTSESGTKTFAAVFDGHGEQGKRISHFARNNMTKTLFGHSDIHGDIAGALQAAYKDTQDKIIKDHSHQADLSGTTAVAAFQHRNRLVVANLGDSRAVLGRCDSAGGQTLTAVDLSSDQKPNRPDERQRILGLGGTVDQMSIPVLQRGGVRWIRAGPERVMDKQGMGGLAMSRSLGDLRLHPYVSATPEIHERKLDSRDKILVLGTDGIWDQISSQEAIDIASKHECPKAAARELTGIARRRWQIATEGQMSDDITAVVVRLAAEPATHSASSAATPPRSAAATVPSRTSLPVASWLAGQRATQDRRSPTQPGSRAERGERAERAERGERGAANTSHNSSGGSGVRLPECTKRPGSNLGRSRSQTQVGGSLRPVSTGHPLSTNHRLHPVESLPPAGHRRNGLP
mmetsp:Transcript_9739/g.17697  ORF Transcript_9739/g.17697 Transcript_9739/m.17697 type:complete len:457 (+) Transcript_9739:92-1462(+)